MEKRARREDSRGAVPRHLPLLVAASAAAGAAIVFLRPLHVDVGFLLDAAGRMLGGERPYVDILEPNPPLILYLMALPAALARLTGADAVTLLRIGVLAIIAASTAASWGVGRRYLPRGVAAFTALTAAAVVVLAEPGEFGQRDGLMLVLLLPYAFAAGSRRANVPIPRREAVALGIAAGVGVALKPFFLLVLVAVDVAVVMARGPRAAKRAEAAAAWGLLLVYAAFVALVHPRYLEIAALAGEHYALFAPIARADLAALGLVIALASAWACVLAWASPGARPLAAVLLPASLAVIVSVILQGKGFPYHWVPAYVAAATILALAAAALAAESGGAGSGGAWRRAPHRRAPALLVALAVGALAWRAGVTTDDAWETLERYPYHLSALRAIVEEAAPGQPVLSFWVAPGFPLVTYSSAEWGSSFSSHWLLPSMHQRELRGEDASATRRRVLEVLARDLEERRPGLLLIDREPRYNNLVGFDFLAFMRSDPAVSAALDRYRELGRVGAFLVLLRSDLGDADAIPSGPSGQGR